MTGFRSILILTSATLMLTGCIGSETIQHDSEVRLTEKANAIKTASECSAQNGAWRQVGRLQIYSCVLPASDAGKACADSSDCQVGCIVKGTVVTPGVEVVGQCLESTDQFGCRTYVSNGKAEHTLCID
ncbi:hypothetical protein [Endozoicomonas ascidiicola]|uniref:hypothetical protein n=1 Tax=Endozoicomonas ascidiicola TaxID=1698521 RepID=UPI0008369BF1|nr:hypothetical protein [Endozoicomonas ascidiicola]